VFYHDLGNDHYFIQSMIKLDQFVKFDDSDSKSNNIIDLLCDVLRSLILWLSRSERRQNQIRSILKSEYNCFVTALLFSCAWDHMILMITIWLVKIRSHDLQLAKDYFQCRYTHFKECFLFDFHVARSEIIIKSSFETHHIVDQWCCCSRCRCLRTYSLGNCPSSDKSRYAVS
jgi:hypothetical protein